MPLTIDHPETAALIGELAKRRGMSEQEAVKLAVQAELGRTSKPQPSFADRVARFRANNPLPLRTDAMADKAFYDDLYGDP